MPWTKDPSVVHRGGHDYWRTWFVEECEQARLFGVTGKHLGLLGVVSKRPGRSTVLKKGVLPYGPGTVMYVEDAPWFPHTGRQIHRVCGPYKVEPSAGLPSGATPIHAIGGAAIVYEDTRPARGPWHDGSRQRVVDGDRLRFRQIASEYDYFPFRFRIVPTDDWHVDYVPHRGNCWLCG